MKLTQIQQKVMEDIADGNWCSRDVLGVEWATIKALVEKELIEMRFDEEQAKLFIRLPQKEVEKIEKQKIAEEARALDPFTLETLRAMGDESKGDAMRRYRDWVMDQRIQDCYLAHAQLTRERTFKLQRHRPPRERKTYMSKKGEQGHSTIYHYHKDCAQCDDLLRLLGEMNSCRGRRQRLERERKEIMDGRAAALKAKEDAKNKLLGKKIWTCKNCEGHTHVGKFCIKCGKEGGEKYV